MIIDKKVKEKLLTFNDTEDIYKQFEKKCAHLSKISGIIIKPFDYKLQYEIHEASINDYIDLQTELYEILYNKYSQLEFGMSGRFKSPFSHYEKVIRKFIDLIEKDDLRPVEILDDFAMKIFIRSITYPVDKVSIDSEGIYIDCGPDEFRISDNPDAQDAFEFDYKGKIINVLVENGQSNIWIDGRVPYISTTLNDEKITLPLNSAIQYKRSNKEDLVPYCYSIPKDVEEFYNSKGFITKKRKDYIARPKESGYSSNQYSFFSEEQNLGVECQIRTQDMEKYNNLERELGYKPSEKTISANSLSKTPRFVLTTKFPDGVHTYAMTDAECFEYIFGMSLKDYSKKMKPSITFKQDIKKPEDKETTR